MRPPQAHGQGFRDVAALPAVVVLAAAYGNPSAVGEGGGRGAVQGRVWRGVCKRGVVCRGG